MRTLDEEFDRMVDAAALLPFADLDAELDAELRPAVAAEEVECREHDVCRPV